MKKHVKCWEFFECKKKECPVYKKKELGCWLVSGTHCRDEIQGKFLEKIEICLDCEPFKANVDLASLEQTLKVVHKQFLEFRRIVEERDSELEHISMELALGLSEVFEALRQISSGDPEARIPETSELELITKLKRMVNLTAGNIAEMVDLSHEFAIGLAEHFDALHRVSTGDLAARVSGISQVELLESLKKVTNEMIESVSREMAERKRAEAQKGALLKELAKSNEKLKQSNRNLQDFVYVASHDLREPLRKVSAFGRILADSLRGKLDEDQKENLGFVIDGANRMQQMTDALLTYSRVTTTAKPYQRVDLNEVICDLRDLELASQLEETNGTIEVPQSLPAVFADSTQMHQLLQNLIGNALKYHKKDSAPKVIVRANVMNNGMVRVEVEDDGVGIEEDHYGEVFTMFRRLHSRSEYEGTGIGLTICKRIVERHGGEIGVESVPGAGSSFWFTIAAANLQGNYKKEVGVNE